MISSGNYKFSASSLSKGYAAKTSLSRYIELHRAFPNVLIIFEHGNFYYGFNETAVALFCLFGCHYYKQKGMLVSKIEASKFEKHFIAKKQMCGFRYIIDRNGKLTFEKGSKGFSLPKPLFYYDKYSDRIQNAAPPARAHSSAPPAPARAYSYTEHGGDGWYKGGWAPGLPSQRFNRKKSK